MGFTLCLLRAHTHARTHARAHARTHARTHRYGEDPYLTSMMGEAFTQQLQQPDPTSKYIRTTAVTRHLVVYSGPESLKDDNTQGAPRFSFNAEVNERDLEDYFYPPFEACISSTRGNSKGAMCSDCAQNGVPSCASELLMTQKPKDWNASDDFFVVSDMGSYVNQYIIPLATKDLLENINGVPRISVLSGWHAWNSSFVTCPLPSASIAENVSSVTPCANASSNDIMPSPSAPACYFY